MKNILNKRKRVFVVDVLEMGVDVDDLENEELIDIDEDELNQMFRREEPTQSEEENSIHSIITKLNNVPNEGMQLVEFDNIQTYKYIPIFDPDGERKNYFSCFCKERDSEHWEASNLLLSNRYYHVNLKKFVEIIKNNIEVIDGSEHVYHTPFVILYDAQTSTNIDIFNDNDLPWLLSTLTGLPLDRVNRLNADTSLGIIITNSYNGKKSLRVDYSLLTRIYSGNNTHRVKDLFTLCDKSFAVKHNSSINDVLDSMCNIESSIQTEIEYFKSINQPEVLDPIIEKLNIIMLKKQKQFFNSKYNALIDEYKNLFFILLLVSMTMEIENKRVKNYLILREYISKILRNI